MSAYRIVSRWDGSRILFERELTTEQEASGMAMRHLLEMATAAKTDLRGADLRGAYLRDADLRDADLGGADLRGADLRDAYLRDADLRGADLGGADLRGAYLRDAYLRDADLRGPGRASDANAIANLDKVREIVLDDSARLEMGHWHADDSKWREKSCVEEMLCGTTHCLAGWLQVCSTDDAVRSMDAQTAGVVSAPVAAKMFFRDGPQVLDWLRDRKYVSEIEEGNRRADERKAERAAKEQA